MEVRVVVGVLVGVICLLLVHHISMSPTHLNNPTSMQVSHFPVISEAQQAILASIRRAIPKLSSSLHKGQMGRIGVIGGSKEYTGAPFLAAMAALRTGADLSHVFCTSQAAGVIKSYSPDLIVHPLLADSTAPLSQTSLVALESFKDVIEQSVAAIEPWLSRLHVLVIGPGLGRDQVTFECVAQIITKARSLGIGLIIDADGLTLIASRPELIKDYQNVIITPNKVEFERIEAAAQGATFLLPTLDPNSSITVVRKGSTDVILHGSDRLECDITGSLRRCGGQGDVLAGAMATFLSWMIANSDQLNASHHSPTSLSAYAASALVRSASFSAFDQHGRSMIASDLLSHLGSAFQYLFPFD